MNKSKNKGRLFWITGISGAGKTTLGKKIKNKIELNKIQTFLLNCDYLRNILYLDL